MRVPEISNLSEKRKVKNYEEGDLEVDSADFGEHPDCTGNVARSNVVHVKIRKSGTDVWQFHFFVHLPSVKVGCISEIIEKKLFFSLYFAQFALPLSPIW